MILIKEVPEYIETKSGKFANVPVSGIVIRSIQSIPYEEDLRDDDFDMFPGFGMVKIYDPRGFNLTISLENFSQLLKNVTIVNGVIQEDLYYVIKDSRFEFFYHRRVRDELRSDKNLWLISEKTETRKLVSSSSFVSGNRYSYVLEDDIDCFFGPFCGPIRRRKRDKEEIPILIYLGEEKRKHYWEGSSSYLRTGLFFNIATREIIDYACIPRDISWFLIQEQDPADLEIMRDAILRFKESRFGSKGKFLKLDISEAINKDPVWDWVDNIDGYIEETKKHPDICGRFVKRVNDKEINVIDIYPYAEYSRRRRIIRYRQDLRKITIEEDGSSIEEKRVTAELVSDNLKAYLEDLVRTSKCVAVNGGARRYIKVIDNAGDESTLENIDNMCLKLE